MRVVCVSLLDLMCVLGVGVLESGTEVCVSEWNKRAQCVWVSGGRVNSAGGGADRPCGSDGPNAVYTAALTAFTAPVWTSIQPRYPTHTLSHSYSQINTDIVSNTHIRTYNPPVLQNLWKSSWCQTLHHSLSVKSHLYSQDCLKHVFIISIAASRRFDWGESYLSRPDG